MLHIYTIVIRAENDEDVQSWAATNVDLEMLAIRSIEDSAFTQDRILRLETTRLGSYCKAAFEASLNYQINDPMSDVIWWNTRAVPDSRKEAA